jgi:hypothetical protein
MFQPLSTDSTAVKPLYPNLAGLEIDITGNIVNGQYIAGTAKHFRL